MAATMTGAEEDGELEIIEVEDIPAEEPAAPKAEADDTADAEGEPAGDEDDDEGEEDVRLAEHEEDDDDESATKRKRKKRRELQKQAKERTLAELTFLREQVAAQGQALQQLQGAHAASSRAELEQRLAEAKRDVADAEAIMERAMESQSHADFIAALKIRDEAKGAEADLTRVIATVQAKPAAPDSRVVEQTAAWKAANAAWYGSNPEATKIANDIDAAIAREGYDPATPAYWQELTRRTTTAFQTHFKADNEDAPRRGKRTPPPQGNTRNHVSEGGRKGVYVTPDRKQAMIDAGVWDDPVQRTRMLKAYEKYDREARSAGAKA